MSSLNQMLDVLHLFSTREPVWTIDDATERLGRSRSTIYRYFRALTDSGLLVPMASGAYTLGPVILKLDRQIRLTDPLLRVAPPLMAQLREESRAVVMLGRFYPNTVLCIHQEGDAEDIGVSFARGRTMPLFYGATTKIILANLATRRLKDIFLEQAQEIREAGLGNDWNAFRAHLRAIRKAGYYVSEAGEVDPGVVGVGAPIFGGQGEILASVSMAISEKRCTPEATREFAMMVRGTAEAIGDEMARLEEALGLGGQPQAEPDLKAAATRS